MDEAKTCFGPIHPVHLPHSSLPRQFSGKREKAWEDSSSFSSLVIVVFTNLIWDFLILSQLQDFPPPHWGQGPNTGSPVLNYLNTDCRMFWTIIIPLVGCKLPGNSSTSTISARHIPLRGLIVFCHRNVAKSPRGIMREGLSWAALLQHSWGSPAQLHGHLIIPCETAGHWSRRAVFVMYRNFSDRGT